MMGQTGSIGDLVVYGKLRRGRRECKNWRRSPVPPPPTLSPVDLPVIQKSTPGVLQSTSSMIDVRVGGGTGRLRVLVVQHGRISRLG